MAEHVAFQCQPRGVARRIGICLLNLAHPGLGMARLGHYRGSLILAGLAFAIMGSVLAYYALGLLLTYGSYIILLTSVFGAWLALLGSAIVLTWRRSKRVEPRAGWLWRWYGVLGLWAVRTGLWLVIPSPRSYYGSFVAVSESMIPTLRPGDRFIADMRRREPLERGDLAIVRSFGENYVMRVAALPGDTITIQNGAVLIDGEPVDRREVGRAGDVKVFRERFPGEALAHTIYDRGATPQDHMPPVKLQLDEFFLLGDNRDNALDSRFGEEMRGPGVVTAERITGRLLFRYWRSESGLEGTAF